MKKLLSLFIMLFLGSNLFSQTERGNIELSASGTFGSYTVESEYSGGIYHSSRSESYNYTVIAFRPGFFLIDNLEIEPELLGTFSKGDEPSFSIAGNLAYNFRIPDSKISPFILAGYGVSNSIPVLNTLLFRSSEQMDIGHLNLGLGVKAFVSQSAAIRVEYRFQRLSNEESQFGFSSSATYSFHKLLFGISLFL